MATFSKKEFAAKCGMPTNKLSVYIKRQKVVTTGEGIDDSLPQNQAFLAKHGGKVLKAAKPDRKAKGKEKQDEVPAEVRKSFGLDLDRKVVEIDRAQLGKQLLQAKIDRIRGDMIPFAVMKSAVDQHFRDCTIHFGQGIQNLLTEVAHKAKLNINQKAELHTAMQKIVNDSVNRAIDATISTLRNIQKEESMKRDVGEKAA